MDDSALHPTPWRAFSMKQLIDLLGFERISGKIQITSRNDVYALYVNRGQILAASSSHRTLRLGHLLLQKGAVEPAFLHDVLVGRRSVPQGRAIGGTLVAQGAVTLAALIATVEDQIAEILSRVIGLENATLVVIADEPVPDGIQCADFETDELLQEADRRHTRRSMIRAMQRLLPMSDAPLRMSAPLGVISNLLTDCELLVALQIDKGSMTLERLGTTLPLEPLALKRAVIGLMERQYVAVR